MTNRVRIALAQTDLFVGDVEGNADTVLALAARARDELHADLIVFPELTLCSYPPEDLLFHAGLRKRVSESLERIQASSRGIEILIGYPHYADRRRIYNSAVLLAAGHRRATYHKQCLPNYGVFDEKRYFQAGNEPCIFAIKGLPIAITICEDVWEPEPARQARDAGALLIVNLNASPYGTDKQQEREDIVAARVRESGVPILYTNLTGGQDELVFDGGSFVMNRAAEVVVRAPAFDDDLRVAEFDAATGAPLPGDVAPMLEGDASVYRALLRGVRDYVGKHGFPGVVIGLSGGIDSALTLALAVDALGPERVQAVMMPSRYTSQMSLEDAKAQAAGAGVDYKVLSIEPAFEAMLGTLEEVFAGTEPDATEENIQARCRGMILMAISNKTGRMVLTTGNKSEMAVGYATLYGDMAGGFAPIKDCSKTLVYRLARYRNSLGRVIPERVITRPPSAELAHDQKDSDSLPDYDVLDPILRMFVEQDASVDEIVAAGFDRKVVGRVLGMVQRNEYKRRQAPPGVRVSRRAFGRDWRYPITSGYWQRR